MKLYIVIGFPASGKSTYIASIRLDATILSRDDKGGTIAQLIPLVESEMKARRRIILDNTNLTKDVRSPFIAMAKKHGYDVEAIYVKSSIEDCQIRCLRRMMEKYGEIYMTGKSEHRDPRIFPPIVLFSARKKLQEPSIEEGFTKITIIETPPPKWDGRKYKNKALFFDPNKTIDVLELYKWQKNGYKLIGISNKITSERPNILMQYCPHSSGPISCYCRKPQVGMVVDCIEKFRLQPKKCLFLCNNAIDRTLANRMRIQILEQTI